MYSVLIVHLWDNGAAEKHFSSCSDFHQCSCQIFLCLHSIYQQGPSVLKGAAVPSASDERRLHFSRKIISIKNALHSQFCISKTKNQLGSIFKVKVQWNSSWQSHQTVILKELWSFWSYPRTSWSGGVGLFPWKRLDMKPTEHFWARYSRNL